jgi:hypothetical protein
VIQNEDSNCISQGGIKMASEERSFEELLREAPASPGAGTVSLVGTLARSSEAGKFVLTLQDGSAVTLETAAVKGHVVLGTSLGQTIVRVDVDSSKLPAGASPVSGQIVKPIFDKPPFWDTVAWFDRKNPWWDPPPKAVLDPKPFADPPWTIVETPGIPGGGGDPFQAGGITPFALATPQQAPPGTLAAMQPAGGWSTAFWWDQPKPPPVDRKRPSADGATGAWPFFD